MITNGIPYIQAGQFISWWSLFWLGLIGTFIYYISQMVKRILFQPNEIIIEYYFRPRREIAYQKINDFGERSIQAGKFSLRTTEFSNQNELLRIMRFLENSKRITRYRLDRKIKTDEKIGVLALWIAGCGAILAVAAAFAWTAWFSDTKLNLIVILMGSFLVIFVLALAVLKILAALEGEP